MTFGTALHFLRKHWLNSLKVLFSIWIIGSTLPHLWRAITHPGDVFRGIFMLCLIVGVIEGWRRSQEIKKQRRAERENRK